MTAAPGASLLNRARRMDAFAMSSMEVRRFARQMRDANLPADVRIAFAGNIVFDPLPEFVETHLACDGLSAQSYLAPFGQSLQEILVPNSALNRFAPTFIVLHFELDALLPGLLGRFDNDAGSWHRRLGEAMAAILPAVYGALSGTDAVVLLTNFAGPDCYDLGLADSRADFSEQEFFAQLNRSVAQAFRAEPRVQILDLCRLTAYHGRGRARDRRLYYVAKLPWHDSFLPVMADEIARHVGVALGRIRKCLVVDLDNTLWGGVLGEDGPHGVRIGIGDPVAEAHFDLQRRILALKKRGILVAACSKNNPDDVEEIFAARTDMPLKRSDFVCMKIGWDMKHEGLREIAAELNIGTDSLVFLDDNPAEIELIRQLMPEVQCVLVPEDPAERPVCLNRVHGLDRAFITAEDLAKTHQYRDNVVRTTARRGFADVRDYLHSLESRIRIRTASPQTLIRVQQLFAKTNQFNVTTRRYTMGELQKIMTEDRCRLLVTSAVDRFGDLGLISVILLRRDAPAEVSIDSFVLSCRAMGRAIESAILNHVKHWCFDEQGCDTLTAEYLPTTKNAPVRELYEEHGFTVAGPSGSQGGKRYRLARERSTPTLCDWIAVESSQT